MREVTVDTGRIHAAALDAALKAALPGKVVGLSSYGDARPVSIWLDDSVSAGEQVTAMGTAQAHDPVFLNVDKTVIEGDGVDTATITINAPKVGAAAVVLMIDGTAVPVALTNGVGSLPISSDPAVIQVTVQNPQNRTMDAVTIEAR